MAGSYKILKWALPSYIRQDQYAAVHSGNEEEKADEIGLLSEKAIPGPRSASRRHILVLNGILLFSFLFAVTSLLVAFTTHYTIVRRRLIGVNLPYGNPIPPGMVLYLGIPSPTLNANYLKFPWK